MGRVIQRFCKEERERGGRERERKGTLGNSYS
jgi:hypothetical protein